MEVYSPITNLLIYLTSSSSDCLLLLGNLEIPQTFNLELLASGATVDVLDIVGGGLKVAGGVVALGEEDIVSAAVAGRLVNGNRGTLETLVSSVTNVQK